MERSTTPPDLPFDETEALRCEGDEWEPIARSQVMISEGRPPPGVQLYENRLRVDARIGGEPYETLIGHVERLTRYVPQPAPQQRIKSKTSVEGEQERRVENPKWGR